MEVFCCAVLEALSNFVAGTFIHYDQKHLLLHIEKVKLDELVEPDIKNAFDERLASLHCIFPTLWA